MSKLLFSLLFLFTVWNLAAQQPGFNRLYDEVPGNNIGNNILTVSDGYYVSGTTVINARFHQFLTKLDITGDVEWQKTYAIDSFGLGGGRMGALVQTFDGNLAMCGELIEPDTSPGAYILVVAANGDSLWHFKQKQFGSYEFSAFYAMCQTADSGFVAVGFARDPVSEYDLLIAKVSKQGTLEWYQTYGDNRWQAGFRVINVNDGLLIGASQWQGSDSDAWLIKTDAFGNMVWDDDMSKTEFVDGLAAIYVSDQDIYVGSGVRVGEEGSQQLRKGTIAKYDWQGNRSWEYEYGKISNGEGFYQLRQDRHGNILAVGSSSLRVNPLSELVGWVLKINPDGDSLFETRFDAAYNNHFEGLSYAWSMDTTLDGGFITGGFVQGEDTMTNENFQNLWVVKFDSNGCFDSTFNCGPPIDTSDTLDGVPHVSSESIRWSLYPNPAKGQLRMDYQLASSVDEAFLSVYSLSGQWLGQFQLNPSASSTELDVSFLSNGMYICRIMADGTFIACRKLMIHE